MKIKVMLLLIFVMLLTGCWSQKELNEIAINVAVGIDKIGDQYLVSCQIVNPSAVATSNGSASGNSVFLYQQKSTSISEAIRKITLVSSRKIYWGHIRMLIVDEKVAREGINDILDNFLREYEVRTDFYIAVTKKVTAESVLKIQTPIEKIPANYMFASLESSEKNWAPTTKVTINDFIFNLMGPGTNPILTGITIIGDQSLGTKKENIDKIKPNSHLKYIGIAIFKKDKLIGWLNESESKGFNYITNNVNRTIGFIKCHKKSTIAFEVIKSKTKIKAYVKHNTATLTLDLHMKAYIKEIQCKNINLDNPETISRLEKMSEKQVKSIIQKTLNTAQKKYKVDILGFGESVHRASPNYWHTHKNKWDETFSKLPVSINVDVNIIHTGTSKNSYLLKEH